MKKTFVVSIKTEEGRLYFVRESSRKIELLGEELLSEPMGIFSHDLKDAKKFETEEQAQNTASYFDGAEVEIIKEGERLK